MKLVIPAIAQSANNFFGRMHPMKRKKLVDQWHTLVNWCLKKDNVKPYSEGYPATIKCTCYFPSGKKRCDWDNLYSTAKLTIDALVRAKILINDSPKYLASGQMEPRHSDTHTEYTIIEITPKETK